MSLQVNQYDEIENICQRWLFRKHEINFDSIYLFCKEINFASPINCFTSRLEKIPYSFTKSETVSGSICFYGGVFTSLLNTGKVEEIEGLFTFALCYMLIDHFLDDIDNSDEEKAKVMKDVYNFLAFSIEEPTNKLIQAAKDRYNELILRNSKIRESLISLFKSEIQGAAISKNRNLSREEYKKIAKEKGGKTSSAIAQIIGISHTEDSPHYICGSLIQYVDDMLDIKDDEELNIYTLARYDYDHGNLDNYIYETMVEINDMGPIYNFFKVILLTGIILSIHDIPHSVSPSLLAILSKYDPFDSSISKSSLNEWFHSKLYQYIEETKNLQKQGI